MPIRVQCSGCGKAFQSPDKLAGMDVKCPNCQSAIHIENASRSTSTLKHDDTTSNTVAIVCVAALALFGVGAAAFLLFPAGANEKPAITASLNNKEEKHSPKRSPSVAGGDSNTNAAEAEIPTTEAEADEYVGFGVSLEELKQRWPVGENWKLLSENNRENGEVVYQLLNKKVANFLITIAGRPDNVMSIGFTFSVSSDPKQGNEALLKLAYITEWMEAYSDWTVPELTKWLSRIIEIGPSANGEGYTVRKGAHTAYAGTIGTNDGALLIISIGVDTSSTKMELDEWLASHPAPAPKPKRGNSLHESNTTAGLVSGSNFGFKNFRSKGGGSFIGEAINKTGVDYKLVSMRLSIYDKAGTLYDSAPIVITNIQAGQTRTFDAYVENPPTNFLYKIDFENGLE